MTSTKYCIYSISSNRTETHAADFNPLSHINLSRGFGIHSLFSFSITQCTGTSGCYFTPLSP